MDDPILIAVAVHDNKEARLEPVEHDRIQVSAGRPATLRISYRFADTSRSREAALLRAILELDGKPFAEKEVAMHDRPFVDDEASGDLVFETPPLRPGLHDIGFTLRLEVSDESVDLKREHTGAGRTLQGKLELQAKA